MRRQWRSAKVVILALIAASILVMLYRASLPKAIAPLAGAKYSESSKQEPVMDERAAARFKQYFEPSLEMRESADFLLTPAILVQESISERNVLTFPAQ